MRISDEWVAGSCACFGIESLSLSGSALAAMKTFYKSQVDSGGTKYSGMNPDDPAAHYVFIAGPETKSNPYGTNFAKYITDNGLGVVVTPGMITNRKYHGSSMCQVWVWQPDKKALIDWWKGLPENNKEPKPRPKPKVIKG